MKKFLFTIFLLGVFMVKPSFASEASQSADTELPKVEYQLPYPGLLPDNPLYSFKTLRDNVIGFLISDPLKKAEFDLLQADKRLNGGIFLLQENKDKEDQALKMISKGENYFEQAISKTKEAKKEGMDTADILRKLATASKKHREILMDLSDKVSPKEKENLNILLERVNNFEKETSSMTPQ